MIAQDVARIITDLLASNDAYLNVEDGWITVELNDESILLGDNGQPNVWSN